jgi:hypothetical protein
MGGELGFVTIYCIAYNATLVEHLRDFLKHHSLHSQYMPGGFQYPSAKKEAVNQVEVSSMRQL